VETEIRIVLEDAELPGDLAMPDTARAVVVFAHGSGSSRMSARNRYVAEVLRSSGAFGTLLFDLLTPAEDAVRDNRFDIALLAARLQAATLQLTARSGFEGMPIGFFGASTGAAAAIVAAVRLEIEVRAIVSRGGRPDLAGGALDVLGVPTLLIVGGDDMAVISLNRQALARIPAADKRLQIVPGATHLFEEPGALEAAAGLALHWFERHLA
jgi:putative phosphoribosyl transferase